MEVLFPTLLSGSGAASDHSEASGHCGSNGHFQKLYLTNFNGNSLLSMYYIYTKTLSVFQNSNTEGFFLA